MSVLRLSGDRKGASLLLLVLISIFLAACTITVSPTATPPVLEGVITGALSYPSDQIPPQQVVATNLDSGESYTVDTALDQATYSLPVPPGSYHVIAYVLSGESDYGGGYTEFVLCGLRADCPSHDLVPVIVGPGETVTGIDLTDWYAPPGSFPSR
ncbi:MAG TPA: hypothetical protein G4N94_14330 [Caldilineae bacterium]|nr:hypothetical protein [Caldilineae bacterium]